MAVRPAACPGIEPSPPALAVQPLDWQGSPLLCDFIYIAPPSRFPLPINCRIVLISEILFNFNEL